jgi:hypothetical protein
MALRETLKLLNEQYQPEQDPVARLAEWKTAVEGLYRAVRANLAEYVEGGLLVPRLVSAARTEELLGTYQINELHLVAAGATVIFSPVAAQVVGAYGRVDLYRRGYADNRYILLRVRKVKGAPAWQIRHSSDPRAEPYTKKRLEDIVDRLLKQS